MSDRRLPKMPTDGYAPPLAVPRPPEPQAPMGQAADYEAFLKVVPWPLASSIGSGVVGNEVSVYTTKKRWRACDVYVQVTQNPNDAGTGGTWVLSVLVYAVTRGRRNLISTGRLSFGDADVLNSTFFPFDAWVCAARAGAEHFEVTVRAEGGDPNVIGLEVSIVATDEAVEPPDDIGEITLRGSVPLDTLSTDNAVQFGSGGALSPPPRLEVRRVLGINTAAAARYLQLYETGPNAAPTTLNMAGKKPLLEWPMGAAAGSGVGDPGVNYRTAAKSPPTDVGANMLLCVSSTPGSYTGPPADGFVYLTVR